MSEFYFGENCTFCQSRIGSTHCLLPYQLVKEYNPPADDMSRIIDVTEIHMRYGIEALSVNLQSINWIKARPDSPQNLSVSGFVQSESNTWSEQMNSLNEQVTSKITSISENIVDSDLESNYSRYIGDQLDLAFLESLEDNGVQVTSPPLASKVSSQDERPKFGSIVILDETQVSDKLSHDSQHVTDKGKSIEVTDDSTKLSRESRNHMISDFVMIAKTAFNLQSYQRTWIKVSSLKESIMHESDLRSRLGSKYTPSFRTTLDGDKAFAKEIIAKHSISDIQEWESGKHTSHDEFCLLNYKCISLAVNQYDQSSLCDELINCFKILLIQQYRTDWYRETVANGVRFELSKDDYSSTFTWMENRAKYLETKKVSKTTTSSGQTMDRRSPKKKEPYPAADERLIDMINTRLQVIVNREIERAGSEVPEMSDETKLTKFFFSLASEFLRRNKGWHNENSFTSPQHLAKIEESTGLRSRPSESSLTFSILKRVIDDFRITFKQKYPKGSS